MGKSVFQRLGPVTGGQKKAATVFQRLGPVPGGQKKAATVFHRLGPVSKGNVFDRLGPVPGKIHKQKTSVFQRLGGPVSGKISNQKANVFKRLGGPVSGKIRKPIDYNCIFDSLLAIVEKKEGPNASKSFPASKFQILQRPCVSSVSQLTQRVDCLNLGTTNAVC